jgi:hypothetical protein
MRDPLKSLTIADIKTMTPAEIQAFWVARQKALAAKGAEHYTTLVEPKTGRVIATVND